MPPKRKTVYLDEQARAHIATLKETYRAFTVFQPNESFLIRMGIWYLSTLNAEELDKVANRFAVGSFTRAWQPQDKS